MTKENTKQLLDSAHFPVRIVLLGVLCGSTLVLSMSWQRASEESRAVGCAGRLCQIGSALRYYHEVHGTYPPVANGDNTGPAWVSWRVLVLPAWMQEDFFEEYRLGEAWNSPHNRHLVGHGYGESFYCPSDSSAARAGVTSYVAVVGKGSVWSEMYSGNVRDVDGQASQKIVVVEVPYPRIYWTEPRDLSVEDAVVLFNSENGLTNSRHRNGLHFLTADGKVHSFKEIDSVDEFVSMLTVAH